jgi:Dolichyl-phosphate-mannose-protein mannosyltransferase
MATTGSHAARALPSKSGLMSTSKVALLGAILVLLLFVAQGISFIRANSQTIDEAMHLAAGYSYLAKGDFRIEPQNPPLIKEILALPLFVGYRLPFRPDPKHWRDADGYLIGRDLLYKSPPTAEQILALSRFPNLLLGAVLVALTGWWAYRLWGNRAAILAVALASLEPNFVAHSSLVTTDIGVTLFIFLTVYLFWEYVNRPTWTLLIATGISTGMALLSKFSAVLLIPMIALIVTASVLIGSERHVLLPSKRNQNEARHKFLQAATVLSLILFVALLTIPPAYFFQGFQGWLSGFYRFLTLSQEGLPAFFVGEYSSHNWWSYFPVAFFIKTPVGSLVLITLSLVFYRAGSPLRYRQALFLVLPVILIFLAMTQAKTNIGLRHILPIYPFLFVLASRLATTRLRRAWLAPLLIGIPVLFTAISSLRIAPHQLAYFNESVGGPEQGYRYLSDSNLDWGQDLKGLKAYMEKEKLPIIYLSYFGTAPPYHYGIRYQYVAGNGTLEWPPPSNKVPADAARKILAISVYNLQDVSRPHDPLFRWLWMRQPVAKIGYSIFIYDLTNDPEGLMRLEDIYVKTGIQRRP